MCFKKAQKVHITKKIDLNDKDICGLTLFINAGIYGHKDVVK